MTNLHYLALHGRGLGPNVQDDASTMFRAYRDHLDHAVKAAKEAASRGHYALGWRDPSSEELQDLGNVGPRNRRASRGRRDGEVPSSATWVVLVPPRGVGVAPPEVYDVVLDSRWVFDSVPGDRSGAARPGSSQYGLRVLAKDKDRRALLLEARPRVIEAELDDAGPSWPGFEEIEEAIRAQRERWIGQHLWTEPNTYGLERQRAAVERLWRDPSPRLAPLLRLVDPEAAWPAVKPETIPDDGWVFLGRADLDGADAQRNFVRCALGTEDFAVLEGPPGSGKTHAIVELIVQLAQRGARVLLVASTHVAVDNVLGRILEWEGREKRGIVMPVRIGDDDRVDELVAGWTYDELVSTARGRLEDFVGGRSSGTAAGAPAREALRDALAAARRRPDADDDVPTPLVRLLLESANLVCGTTIGILKHPALGRRDEPTEPFDVMILDEASKTTFTEFLVPAVHAKRWVVVGDVRQLSPYVDGQNVVANLEAGAPAAGRDASRAAVFPFLTRFGTPAASSVVAVEDDASRAALRAECVARNVPFVDLDLAEPGGQFNGHVVFAGTAAALERFAAELSSDVRYLGGHVPTSLRTEGRDSTSWSEEVAWRLSRSWELRRNAAEGMELERHLVELLPKTASSAVVASLQTYLAEVRRVTMASILEILQHGAGRLREDDPATALTDGLPEAARAERLVSLTHQHRMHPDIARFPREQFYTQPGQPQLLLDARDMDVKRPFPWGRYGGKRAVWLNVSPRDRRTSLNEAEADVLLDELTAFRDWAKAHPRIVPQDERRGWQVAVLTFYLEQEELLAKRLRRAFGGTRGREFVARGAGHEPCLVIRLCTVDRFQGHEADIVYLSFARNRGVGFLNGPGRLNVALTRARHQLVVIGDQRHFRSDHHRSDLLRAMASHPAYPSAPTWRSP